MWEVNLPFGKEEVGISWLSNTPWAEGPANLTVLNWRLAMMIAQFPHATMDERRLRSQGQS